jgi:hypothetical protein
MVSAAFYKQGDEVSGSINMWISFAVENLL